MEKNKTYKVWRMLVSNPSDNECLQIGRIRDCKKYLEAVREAYENLGWKLIVADRTLIALPTIDAGVEYIYIITENVSGDIEFKM
jgi:hypothetical protein